jgi:3',5'-cyclic AMP phosphodiesterase CpdA
MYFLRKINYAILLILGFFASSCATQNELSQKEIKLAVIADVHLQDVYGTLEDSDYKGIKNPSSGADVLIRTMGSQLRSTRIFNENYFAFLAALDDVVEKNIKHVLLPGDFSDDGQPLHIRGLKKILEKYSKNNDISFFLATGNHDVVRPFNHNHGKKDFLGEGGKQQPIFSDTAMYMPDSNTEHPVVITKDIQNLGYDGISQMLGVYGFYPKPEYSYWATPFSKYTYKEYNYEVANLQASLQQRSFLIESNKISLPDLSYVVEPVEGLWLISLDANTYLEKQIALIDDNYTLEYPNTGLGHDNLLTNKSYLVDWVGRIVQEAEKYGKTLIAFSHYPMVDFTNGASEEIGSLLVGAKMQNSRVPNKKVAEIFAQAGLKLHFGGHMHMNDTGVHSNSDGKTLINVQVPSLAAYKPAYKVVTLKNKGIVNVETVLVNTVPSFNEFFELYKQEYDFLKHSGDEKIWDRTILSSIDYGDFTNWHLKELVRLRFLPSDWPKEFSRFLLNSSGKELLALSHAKQGEGFEDLMLRMKTKKGFISNLLLRDEIRLRNDTFNYKSLEGWSGADLLFDLYRLRSADQLAQTDIGRERLKEYQLIATSFMKMNKNSGNDAIKRKMLELMSILDKFMNGAPSNHFQINMNSGLIKPLKP